MLNASVTRYNAWFLQAAFTPATKPATTNLCASRMIITKGDGQGVRSGARPIKTQGGAPFWGAPPFGGARPCFDGFDVIQP